MTTRPLDHIKLIKLRVFYEVAEGRNPSTTMRLTYRTTQRYIQTIEEALEYKLFDGYRQRKNLTKQGIVLHAMLKKAFGELDRLNMS